MLFDIWVIGVSAFLLYKAIMGTICALRVMKRADDEVITVGDLKHNFKKK